MRVGIDLVDVAEVRDAMTAHGDRYLERVYTDGEVDDCRSRSGEVLPERLAARFAAKEAVIKVLQPEAEGMPWRSIEVRGTDARRAPEVALSGAAARRAAECGVTGLMLSLSNRRRQAMAVAVGRMTGGVDR